MGCIYGRTVSCLRKMDDWLYVKVAGGLNAGLDGLSVYRIVE